MDDEKEKVIAERDAALARLDDARRRIDWIAQERDRFAVDLVRVEQQLAEALEGREPSREVGRDAPELQARLDELMAYAGGLEQELTAIRATVSWRITRPLRWIQSHIRPHRAG